MSELIDARATVTLLRSEAAETMARRKEWPGYGTSPVLLQEAADEIERLRAAIGQAQAHLDRGDEADQLIAKALRSVL